MPMKVGLISLGCDKNRVDSEKMIARLVQAGYEFTCDEKEADVILVNTCAFIESAKKESIDTILDVATLKKERPNVKIVVAGCFPSRYEEESKEGFPEVDAFVPVKEEPYIVRHVNALFGLPRYWPITYGRILTTPHWYAYFKIADGCNNHCAYCAIPAIRGKYSSIRPELLLSEAKVLADNGVKELIVVAQDTTMYGVDLYKQKSLVKLLRHLCALDFWKVRLLYAYPERIDDELLDFIDNEPKMAKYLDIPMQHADGDLLKKMNRASTEEGLRALMKRIRACKNYIAVRSSFIVGFPSETDEAQKKLCDFVAEYVDYAGFFVFSPEEGTPAYDFPDKVKVSLAKKRKTEAEKAWQVGMVRKQKRFFGKTVEVLCDGISEDGLSFVGRTEYQTPDVDTKVYFTADFNVMQGEIYKVKITDVGFDLMGVAVKEDDEV